MPRPPIVKKAVDDVAVSKRWSLGVEVAKYDLTSDWAFRPTQPRPPVLHVPLRVRALYVGHNHEEKFAVFPYALSEPDISDDDAFPKPFSPLKSRPPGVHLHMIFPEGLLNGSIVGEELAFETLPDKVTITRYVGVRGEIKLRLKTWEIDARTGQVHDLAGNLVSENGVQLAKDQLTPVSGGGAEWLAGYDATRGRYAFHDDLADLEGVRVLGEKLSYAVSARWSEQADEPLKGLTSVSAVHSALTKFGWTASDMPIVHEKVYADLLSPVGREETKLPEALSKLIKAEQSDRVSNKLIDPQIERLRQKLGASEEIELVTEARRRQLVTRVLPPQIVFSGSVFGVVIARNIPRDLAPKAERIQPILAQTIDGLIASMAADSANVTTPEARQYYERLMSALANDSLVGLHEVDGIVAIDEAAHHAKFEAFDGAEVFEDVVVENFSKGLNQGRPARTKIASQKQKTKPVAETVWVGRRLGSTANSKTEQNERAKQREKMRFPNRKDTATDRNVRRISRKGPRLHRAKPPVLAVRNFGRSMNIRGMHKHRDDRLLQCRWQSELGNGYEDLFNIRDFLPNLSYEAAGEASTWHALLNAVTLDLYLEPWLNTALTKKHGRERGGIAINRHRAELALRYDESGVYTGVAPILRGSTVSNSTAHQEFVNQQLFNASKLEGVEASPAQITSWAQPWDPIWFEWEIEVDFQSGNDGWELGQIDLIRENEQPHETILLQGRSPITTGLEKDYVSAIENYLELESQRDETGTGEIGDGVASQLEAIQEHLSRSDIGMITLDKLTDYWLGLPASQAGQIVQINPDGSSQPLLPERLPILLRSSRLELRKLRVIDSFGRVRDSVSGKIIKPLGETFVKSKRVGTSSIATPTLQLPPRLSVPSRLMWRFVDAANPSSTARDANLNQDNQDAQVSPLAGWLLPDFLDEAIEFFDRDGNPLGQIMRDPLTGFVTWEIAPGRPGPASASPDFELPPSAREMGEIAKAMIVQDAQERAQGRPEGFDDPLTAFLRSIDTSMFTVSGHSNVSSASIAGLVGHPIAVVRANLALDIPNDIHGLNLDPAAHQARIEERLAAFDALKAETFDVRLGEVSRLHDGLYGYFVNGKYQEFNLVEGAIAAEAVAAGKDQGFNATPGAGALDENGLPTTKPILARYLRGDDKVSIHPSQTMRLTLLMHPFSEVNATMGFLPRKKLRLLKDWVAKGLEAIAPSARIGPVIIDPDKVRLPKIAAYGTSQNWIRRDGPITWREDPILASTQAALLPTGRVTVEEGYIRIVPQPDPDGGG